MANFILNTVWFLVIGWAIGGIMLIVGVLLCCTILGIPLGIVVFKQVMPVSFPFGRKVDTGHGGIIIINNNNTTNKE